MTARTSAPGSLRERLLRVPAAGAWPLFLACLAIALTFPSLATGLVEDDYFQQAMIGQVPSWDLFRFWYNGSHELERFKDLGLLPWWMDPETHLWFFRPLASLSHWFDYKYLPGRPEIYHAENIALYATLVAIVAVVYRRVAGIGTIAGLAGLLFVVNDSHADVVQWIASRNSLLAAVFGFTALIVHVQGRQRASASRAGLASLLFALALLSAEAGLASFAYLLAYSLSLDQGSLKHRLLSLLPYVAIMLIWLACRRALGYGVHGLAALYTDPLAEPVLYLRNLPERVLITFSSIFTAPAVDSNIVALIDKGTSGVVAGWAVLVVLGSLFWISVRKHAASRFFALGTVLCVPLVCMRAFEARNMLFMGVGALGLIAIFITRALGERQARLPAKAALVVVSLALLVAHLVLAPLRLVENVGQQGANARIGASVDFAESTFPSDHDLDKATLVFVHAPDFPAQTSWPYYKRRAEGKPAPARLRVLVSDVTTAFVVSRIDERTLAVNAPQGYPQGGWLTGAYGLPGMAVEVKELMPDGTAKVVWFRFDVPLEHPSLRWLTWSTAGWIRFSPPAIGEQRQISL